MLPFRLLVVLASTLSAVNASLQIVPGGTWTASNGEHLNAHGAGVLRVNGTYYLIGEDKSQGSAFINVNCYSSTDLVRWKYEGALLSRTGSGDLGPNRIIERPKVIYNDQTKKYVLWMHVDSSNYGDAKVGVATGDTVCGKYSYIKSFRPLGFQSRDMGLFKDDDGSGYLLTEDRENGVRINKLTADYTDVAGSTYLWKDRIEAPALVKLQGRYYMFGSHLTGWDANDNVYSTSTSLTSGWSAWQTFADAKSNTYNSQTTYVLDYGGGNVMYMGDRWVSKNLQASTYVWLPLSVSGTKVTMKNFVSWVPNLDTASAWATPPEETSYEGEKATYSGGTKDVSCSGCSGGKAAGYVGGDNAGKVSFSGIRSDAGGLTTVRIKYNNGDSKPRYAQVTVNGGSPVKIAFEPNSGDPASSSLNVELKTGSANTIVIEGVSGGWAPDIDRLMVPVR
ncbi:glycoside hydrolase family 43 protein [Coniochaeta sp. PMI_546]|nr:glycoside hydrolase family 43 protein [Coniochaeta sp. PMI_546]